MLGGWQISGLTSLELGPAGVAHYSESTNGYPPRQPRRTGRRPEAGNQMAFPYWFDPAAFAPAADGNYGNSARAIFRQPGRNQTDLSLSKNFYQPHAERVQFRADFINAFNHTQWLAVDNACGVSLATCVVPGDTFGTITSTRNPREIQLSLKLFW